MTAAWMVYGLLVGGLLAASACGLDAACRLARRPGRAIWLVAMLATVALVGVAPLRREAGVVVSIVSTAQGNADATVEPARGMLASIRRNADAGASEVRRGLAGVAQRVPGWLDRALAILWAFGTGAAALWFLVVHRRFRRERRGWRAAELDGMRVRIAPKAGPAAIGIVRPEIVVPRWLLGLAPEQRRAALLHEAEHVRARDPLLLSVAWLAAILVPWNLAVWWMLSRLRLAAELDCDARLLRSGLEAHRYGTLLIDMAGRGPSLGLSAAAFADRHTHLRTRLEAMIPRPRRFAGVRLVALGVFALGGTLVACEAALPTDADVQKMDVSSAERAGRFAGLLTPDGSEVVYLIDGKSATAEQAHALGPQDIGSVSVKKAGAQGGRSVVSILTRDADVSRPDERGNPKRAAELLEVARTRARSSAGEPAAESGSAAVENNGSTIRARTMGTGLARDANPLIFINGVRASGKDLNALGVDRIERIEVLKGETARKAYSDPDAANGVIQITTRKP